MRWLLLLLIIVIVVGGFWMSRKAFRTGRRMRRDFDDRR